MSAAREARILETLERRFPALRFDVRCNITPLGDDPFVGVEVMHPETGAFAIKLFERYPIYDRIEDLISKWVLGFFYSRVGS
jgi:hypothetical protein